MKTILCFSKGFKATGKAYKMVTLLFLINLIFSLLAAVPMYTMLKDSFGKSEAGDKMVKSFDYLWWEEFRDESKGIAVTFTPSIISKGTLLNNLENFVGMRFLSLPSQLLVLGILYIILHTFLAGGILSVFNQDSPSFSMKRFFEGAGRYFLRFLLLTLISWVLFYGVISLQRFLSSIRENISKNAFTEVPPFIFWLFASMLIFFLLMFIQMLFDYSRIHLVTEESSNILKSMFRGFSFVFRHIGSTIGLYYLIFVSSTAAAVLYVVVKGFVPQSNLPAVVLAFLIQQIFIFTVVWVRCWLYSSQILLYKKFR